MFDAIQTESRLRLHPLAVAIGAGIVLLIVLEIACPGFLRELAYS